MNNLEILGSDEYIDVAGVKKVPAKVDTGADSSSVWASHIRVTKDGVLHFRLFDEESPYYTGKTLKRTNFKVAVVRSSIGHEQIRYRTHLLFKIKGRKIKAMVTLSDRSKNSFPVLIGRRTISGKFVVDVSKNHTMVRQKGHKTKLAQKKFREDPYKFHCEYIEKAKKGVKK